MNDRHCSARRNRDLRDEAMPTSKMHLNTSTFTRAMWKQQNKCPDAHFCNKKPTEESTCGFCEANLCLGLAETQVSLHMIICSLHTHYEHITTTHMHHVQHFSRLQKKKKFHSCNALSLQDTKFQTGCNVFKQCILAPRS